MAKLKTGRHTSAIKAARQARTRYLRNRRVRGTIRDAAKKMLALIAGKDTAAVKKLSPELASLWDKAAKNHVVHWKTAARKKSRLAKRANALSAPAGS